MERSWLSKKKQKAGTLYAVKNLSMGLLSIGKGHLGPGLWATSLSEWEVTKRGLLAHPETDCWLCVTMEQYQRIIQEDAAPAEEPVVAIIPDPELTPETSEPEAEVEPLLEEESLEMVEPVLEAEAAPEAPVEVAEKPKKRKRKSKKSDKGSE